MRACVSVCYVCVYVCLCLCARAFLWGEERASAHTHARTHTHTLLKLPTASTEFKYVHKFHIKRHLKHTCHYLLNALIETKTVLLSTLLQKYKNIELFYFLHFPFGL